VDRDHDAAADGIRACFFDVFGTVVDWQGGVSRELATIATAKGITGIDWLQFAKDWRALYNPAMQEVRSGRRPFVILDVLHRENLLQVLEQYGLGGFSDDEIDGMTRAWHRLDPWPDAVAGLTRLKTRFMIAACSNGNIALIVNMAKRGGLPWDAVLGAEPTRAYKPDPEAYLASCRMLDVTPDQTLMVAAHNHDLAAARACGLRTAFVLRPTEYDTEAGSGVDLSVGDFVELAAALGC
jgi:2-haloacid dehalogenase